MTFVQLRQKFHGYYGSELFLATCCMGQVYTSEFVMIILKNEFDTMTIHIC